MLQLTKYVIIYYFEVHLLGKSFIYMNTKHSKWILNFNLLLKKNKRTQLKEKPLDSINIHYPCFIQKSSVNAINLWHNRSCKEQIFFLNMKFKQHLSLTLDYPVFSLILPSILWTEHWWWFGFFSSGGREFSASSLCTHSGFLLPKHACAVCAFPPCRTTVKN